MPTMHKKMKIGLVAIIAVAAVADHHVGGDPEARSGAGNVDRVDGRHAVRGSGDAAVPRPGTRSRCRGSPVRRVQRFQGRSTRLAGLVTVAAIAGSSSLRRRRWRIAA